MHQAFVRFVSLQRDEEEEAAAVASERESLEHCAFQSGGCICVQAFFVMNFLDHICVSDSHTHYI